MRRPLALLIAVAACAALAACGTPAPATPPTTVTVTAPPAGDTPDTPNAKPPVRNIAVPDVVGDNGAIALDQLNRLGFTDIQPASRDENDKFVLNPANWTVTKVDPKAGTKVPTDRTLVVTMTKK